MAGPRRVLEERVEEVGVLVLVDIDDGVGAKIDRIRARCPAAVVVVRIQHLHAERLPPAGRPAVHEARPRLADAAEGLLDVRHELVGDGIAVWAEVLRVHRVAVVVVRVGVLDLDDEEAWKVRPGPQLVEPVRLLLLGAVVAGQVEALARHAFQRRVGRLLAKAGERVGKVTVIDDEGITRVGVLIESLGQEDVRAEIHRAAPELRQPLALDLHVLDVPGRRWIRNRRDHLVEADPNRLGALRVEGDFPGRRVEVAGRLVPLLPFAAVHRQLHGVAVRALEGLVLVQERLDRVGAGGYVRERFAREPEHTPIECGVGPGCPAVDVDAERLLRPRPVDDLCPRFGAVVARDHQDQASVHRRLRQLRGEGDENARPAGLPFLPDDYGGHGQGHGCHQPSRRSDAPRACHGSAPRVTCDARLCAIRPATGCRRFDYLGIRGGGGPAMSGRISTLLPGEIQPALQERRALRRLVSERDSDAAVVVQDFRALWPVASRPAPLLRAVLVAHRALPAGCRAPRSTEAFGHCLDGGGQPDLAIESTGPANRGAGPVASRAKRSRHPGRVMTATPAAPSRRRRASASRRASGLPCAWRAATGTRTDQRGCRSDRPRTCRRAASPPCSRRRSRA